MNIFQCFDKKLPSKYQDCVDNVKQNKPSNVKYSFSYYNPINSKDIRYETDLYRFQIMLNSPTRLWLDCDVKINSWFDFPKTGKPYFANAVGDPDIWAIYCNHCQDYFKWLLSKYEPGMYKGTYIAWWDRFINKNDIYIIPNGYFEHLRLHNR